VHLAYILWSSERLVQDEVINQITVDPEITREALVALNGMLPCHRHTFETRQHCDGHSALAIRQRGQNLATKIDAERAIRVRGEGEGMSVTVGEMAPEFSLRGTTGPGLDLAELRGKGRAALFFYPADRTAG
jgi:hypothetical protein